MRETSNCQTIAFKRVFYFYQTKNLINFHFTKKMLLFLELRDKIQEAIKGHLMKQTLALERGVKKTKESQTI